MLGNNRNDIYAVFDQLDVDKNDAITYDEFVKHLDGLNLGLSTQQVGERCGCVCIEGQSWVFLSSGRLNHY